MPGRLRCGRLGMCNCMGVVGGGHAICGRFGGGVAVVGGLAWEVHEGGV